MCKKLYIFVDWDNLRREIKSVDKYGKYLSILDANAVIKFIKKFRKNDEEIQKIHFYTAKPINKKEIPKLVEKTREKLQEDRQQDLKKYKETKYKEFIELKKLFYDARLRELNILFAEESYDIQNFLNIIKSVSLVELQLGKLIIDPYHKSFFKQKQVDTAIVVGIADIAYNKNKLLADRILLFSNDKDLAPALECAKNKGLEVFLAAIKENDIKRANELKNIVGENNIRYESIITLPPAYNIN